MGRNDAQRGASDAALPAAARSIEHLYVLFSIVAMLSALVAHLALIQRVYALV